MTMTNAEWMIKNGYKFSDVCLAGSDDTIAISLNGKSLGKVPGFAYFAAFREWLDMEHKEHKEPILNDVERRYLRSVIRPFSDRVAYIVKADTGDKRGYCHIRVGFINASDDIYLPSFHESTMYNGMKNGYAYSLEELGL